MMWPHELGEVIIGALIVLNGLRCAREFRQEKRETAAHRCAQAEAILLSLHHITEMMEERKFIERTAVLDLDRAAGGRGR